MKKLRLKSNCRVDNYCVFCGKQADVNYINGKSEIFDEQGLCSQHNEYREPTDLCKYFSRNILYM